MSLKHSFLLILSLILFGACRESEKSKSQIHEILPLNTVWLAEINDWEEVIAKKSNSRVLDLLSQFGNIKNFHSHWRNAAELSNQDSLQELMSSSQVYLAEILSGADRYNWLLILLNDEASAERLFRNFQKADGLQSLEYSSEKIYQLKLNEKQDLFLHHSGDLYLISGDRIALEAAIRQKNSPTQVAENDRLRQIRESRNPRSPLNIYLNLKSWPDYLSTLGKLKTQFLADMGDWLLLDLDAETHDLIATGLLNHPETEAYFPQALASLRSDQIQAQKLIPVNLARWVHMSIGNIGQYQRAFEAQLEKAGTLKDHQEIIAKLPANVGSQLAGIIDSEMGTFQAGRAQNQAYEFAYFNFRDAELAEKTLEALSDSNFIEGYRGHVIRKLSPMNLLPRLYGSVFEAFHQPYYLIHKDYVLLGNQLASLKVVLNDILDSKTLDRSDSYLNLSNQLPGKAQVQIVYGIPEWLPNQKEALNKGLSEELESLQDSLQNLRWAILQLRADKDRSFVSAMIREEQAIKEKIVRQWSVQLEGQPSGAPQFLKNHNNQKLDIAIQDENHRLYLISRKGEVYWTKELDGPIIGDIRQIDIYRNNKLQMVFNTANQLWVLDRLGRNVEGFPVKLKAESTAPVGVFNYDQARNYRLVVPCGPMLYNFDVEGKVVKGWNFKKAASDIVSEPQFFSVAGKDIIVCLTAEGKLYQLNRRGEERFKVEEKIEELKTSFYLKAGESLKKSELIAGSNSGKMYVINPEGKVDALYLDRSHPASHLIYFEGRYIFSDGAQLFVKDDRMPFEASLEDDISLKPKAMILNNRFYTAAFSAGAEEIRLFNEEGNLVDGFPVFAQGPFDMGSLNRDKSLNIVTYSNDGTLICYRLR